MSNKLAKLLEKEGLFSKKQFKDRLKQARSEGRYLTPVLLEQSDLPSDKTLKILADFFDLPIVDLKERRIAPAVLDLIPKELAEQHSVIIFKKVKDQVYVATAAPEDRQTFEFIQRKTGLEPQLFLTTPEDIRLTLRRYDTEISEDFAKIIQAGTKEALATHESAEKMAQFMPIIKMVNNIIERALIAKASDIHVEPQSHNIVIRFRLDGLLHKMVELPKEILPALTTRIKLLANLKIDEHRLPQDGRFQFNFADQEVAIRVSVLPTLYGSKIALRLLDMQEKPYTLRKLGLNRNDFKTLKKAITASQGMILVTGPTGSGKTTTLYTLLRMLNSEQVNICTVEDPIEYGIDGINQTQINPRAGLTFANGLRSLLRQDPNIVMVGEIRDGETADIAMNSGMTGHLVLSTLHTNNAFLAPQRLIEMGVQPYLVSSVVSLMIGQRLVRKICPNCKSRLRSVEKILTTGEGLGDIKATFNKFKKLNLVPEELNWEEAAFYHGRGCNSCSQTGYQGRIGIYEVVEVNQPIRDIILADANETAIKKSALAQGTLTMAEDGLLKVILGRTTCEEVLRVTKE